MEKKEDLYGRLGVGCFGYYFAHNGVKFRLDASEETTYLGSD